MIKDVESIYCVIFQKSILQQMGEAYVRGEPVIRNAHHIHVMYSLVFMFITLSCQHAGRKKKSKLGNMIVDFQFLGILLAMF